MPELHDIDADLITNLMDLVDEHGLMGVYAAMRTIYKDRFCNNCGHIKPEEA